MSAAVSRMGRELHKPVQQEWNGYMPTPVQSYGRA